MNRQHFYVVLLKLIFFLRESLEALDFLAAKEQRAQK